MEWIWLVAMLLVPLAVVLFILLPRYFSTSGLDPESFERRKLQNESYERAPKCLAVAFFLITVALTWQEIQNQQAEIQNTQQQLEWPARDRLQSDLRELLNS